MRRAGVPPAAAGESPNSRLRVGILASGRGTNLQAILDATVAGTIPADVVCVVSDNPEAEALNRARRRGVPAVSLPAEQFPNRKAYHDALLETLARHDVGLVTLAGYMRRIPGRIVQRYRWRMMNIHPSLLPAFPGLEPQRQAIEHGVKVSGCTVHFVDEGVDTGPIILQSAVPVDETDDVDSLSEKILKEEHRVYPEAVRLFAAGRLYVSGRRVLVRSVEPADAGDRRR